MFDEGVFGFRGIATFILFSPSGKGLHLVLILVCDESEDLPCIYLEVGMTPEKFSLFFVSFMKFEFIRMLLLKIL